MKNEKKAPRGVTIGITSIVVLFVVIAMTIFAVLTLSTVAQEKKLADKSAAAIRAYWADDEACSEIASRFGRLWADGADAGALRAAAAEADAVCYEQGDETRIDFSRVIDDTRKLSVSLALGDSFRIVGWKTEALDQEAWQPDTEIDVWQGDEMEVIG
jgi:hypothetical protein